MNKLFQLLSVVLCFFFFGMPITEAQSNGDTTNVADGKLTYTKSFGNFHVQQNGKPLTQDQVFDLFSSNYRSADYMKKYKTKSTLAAVMGGVGGALFGFPVGMFIGGGEPIWEVALIGAGVVAVAIPIGSAANKDFKRAIEVYNEDLPAASSHRKGQLHFSVSGHGLGIGWRF